jgi:PPOX class probable F420-dependent enzyme
MPAELTDAALAIIDGKNFAHVSTLLPDGSPQVTPVWIDAKDGFVRINSAEGRKKVKNLREDPRIAIEVNNHENPYEYVEIRGKVVEFTHDGADDHIDALAKKYLDADTYPYRDASEQRVTIVIEPEKVLGNATSSAD